MKQIDVLDPLTRAGFSAEFKAWKNPKVAQMLYMGCEAHVPGCIQKGSDGKDLMDIKTVVDFANRDLATRMFIELLRDMIKIDRGEGSGIVDMIEDSNLQTVRDTIGEDKFEGVLKSCKPRAAIEAVVASDKKVAAGVAFGVYFTECHRRGCDNLAVKSRIYK